MEEEFAEVATVIQPGGISDVSFRGLEVLEVEALSKADPKNKVVKRLIGR